MYAELLDVDAEVVLSTLAARVGPTFARETVEVADRAARLPGLTARERDVAILTALVAGGVTGDRLDSHLRVASGNGMAAESLATLFTLLAGYVGLPRTSLAMESVRRVLGDDGSGT